MPDEVKKSHRRLPGGNGYLLKFYRGMLHCGGGQEKSPIEASGTLTKHGAGKMETTLLDKSYSMQK